MTQAVHTSSKGVQEYTTPADLIEKIEKRFGIHFALDAAASVDNTRCHEFYDESDNALGIDWVEDFPFLVNSGHGVWLNPPFRHMGPWMEKCAEQAGKGAKIVSLTLSSLGSNWFQNHVRPNALSIILTRRVTFEGQPAPYTKELMISLWGFKMHGLSYWDWKA